MFMNSRSSIIASVPNPKRGGKVGGTRNPLCVKGSILSAEDNESAMNCASAAEKSPAEAAAEDELAAEEAGMLSNCPPPSVARLSDGSLVDRGPEDSPALASLPCEGGDRIASGDGPGNDLGEKVVSDDRWYCCGGLRLAVIAAPTPASSVLDGVVTCIIFASRSRVLYCCLLGAE